MTVFRLLAAVSFAGCFVLAGVQVYRVLDQQTRSITLSWGALTIGVVCIVAILAWTYATVENCRRILAPAETQELPDPRRAVLRWGVPVAFVVPGAAVVLVLSRRWNDPAEGTSSSIPLLIAFGIILVSLLLLYAPLSYLAVVLRRIGGQSGNLLAWAWVPVVLAAVGGAAVFGMRAFGTFDDPTDGIAPGWMIALVLLLPVVVVFFVGHSAAVEVEDTVRRAFRRRIGKPGAVSTRRSLLPSLYGADHPNRKVLVGRGPIRLVPGTSALRLGVVTLLAGISLLSLVGAIVMFLFWRESTDGLLLPSHRDRAWDVLEQLRSAERVVAFTLVGVTMLWTLVAVYNARAASGRRRNPLLAAAAWPAAAYGVWAVGSRLVDTTDAGDVVSLLTVQAAIAYVPFFLLERAATAIGARRSPIRIVFALGVVMLVYMHGLGGLSMIGQVAEADQFGRIAAYLGLGAVVLLLSTLAVTEACLALSEASRHEAENHNLLLGQRGAPDERTPDRPAGPYITGPNAVVQVAGAPVAVD